jgi:transcriptional regulator with XRE-family HTH domain
VWYLYKVTIFRGYGRLVNSGATQADDYQSIDHGSWLFSAIFPILAVLLWCYEMPNQPESALHTGNPMPARLQELRAAKGVSLRDVARAIGSSKAHVWELEIGRRANPTLEMLRKLSKYYGVCISVLIGELALDQAEDLDVLHIRRRLAEMSPEQRRAFRVVTDMLQTAGEGPTVPLAESDHVSAAVSPASTLRDQARDQAPTVSTTAI